MWQLQNSPGRTCLINGKEFLFFSGYSYLGMNHVEEFINYVKEGIDKYGILFPSSRISNTRLGLYDEFENYLSALTGLEDTVTFSSGFLAGKTIAEILSSYKNIFIAPSAHPAIVINTAIKSNSQTFEEWLQQSITAINASEENEFVLIADSINIMESVVHDFSFLQNIKAVKKIIFLIDDSHAIGILGKAGEGIISQLPQKNNLDYIITFSLSKAFSIAGGAVSCSKEFAAKLRQHPNYSGSTSISPGFVHAFLSGKNLYASQREKLFKNIEYLKANTPSSLKENKTLLPIFICKDEKAETAFYQKNIIISSFAYPHPYSKKVNRVIINALHTNADIDRL